MRLPGIHWPLASNVIRRHSLANTFGMVRNGGKRAHQGWDLLAYPGTRCFAIADGTVAWADVSGDYGRTVIIKFEHRGRTLYAAYAHLGLAVVKQRQTVVAGEWIGVTGNTGNAAGMTGEDQHLHFEIRTAEYVGHGLGGRIDPRSVYGVVPLNTTYYDTRPPMSQKLDVGAPGLKMPGVNVL